MRARSLVLSLALVAAPVLVPASPPSPAHGGAAGPEAGAPGPAAGPFVSEAPALPAIRRAADFDLADTAGRRVRLADLRGRVVLISFVYTSCTTACPLVSARMAALEARLREADPQGRRVALLSVTVDPARDGPAELEAYGRRFGADPARWRFLRETPTRLAPVLAAYDEWTRHAPGGDLDHPARLHLLDAEGRTREIYGLSFFDDRQALADIRALLRRG